MPASGRQEERDQSSSRNGNRRASRDATVQQATADENNATASSGDRRQEREINRGSSRRRDRTARDNGAAEDAWERAEYDRTSDRTYDRRGGRRGNRYDEDRGAGDRRIVSQAVREDDGIVARGPRYGGPMGLFSFGNNW